MRERFSGQILLPEIGKEGQKKISEARVLMVGAGGLGCPVLSYLVAGGVGNIGIIDPDRVDLSNLQRQILFTQNDVGRLKVEVAKERLQAMNSAVSIETYPEFLSTNNVEKILLNYDIVVDGSDNFATKYLLNDACVKWGRPLVLAALFQFQAQWGVFLPTHGPCYRCLYPQIPRNPINNCEVAGVLGMVAGVVGSFQALEVIKCIVNSQQEKWDTFFMMEFWNTTFKKIKISKDPACICAHPEKIILSDGLVSCRS